MIEDIDLINHTQKIDVNFLPNIGKKLNGFFLHHSDPPCLGVVIGV